MIRVEICGGIASGKTTLATLISTLNFQPLFENFKTNPFWNEFFTDPAKFAFETEISFMLQHYNQIKKNKLSSSVVCDYSFFLDIAYAHVGLEGSQLSAFLNVYTEINKELSFPELLIHLKCDSKTELERIHKRARPEEDAINGQFLNALNKAIDLQVGVIKNKVKVITIDSASYNFADDSDVKREIVRTISSALKLNELRTSI